MTKFRIKYFIIIIILIIGMYIAGLRTTYITLSIFSLTTIVYLFFKKTGSKSILLLFSIFIFQLGLLMWNPGINVIQKERFDNLTELENNFNNDAPINTRIEGYKVAFEIFSKHPFFGTGFGGYTSESEFTNCMRYPHNIILELASELGIVGVLYFISLIVFIKYKLRHSSYFLWLFFIFAVIQSLTSKDIPDQTHLLLFLPLLCQKKPSE